MVSFVAEGAVSASTQMVSSEDLGEVLNTIAAQTKSELVQFFLIFAVILIAFFAIAIPLFNMKIKSAAEKTKEDNKADVDKLDKYIAREGQIIHVIQQNTEVIAGIKTLLEQNNTKCDKCRSEQMVRFQLIEDKLNQNNIMLTEMLTIIRERVIGVSDQGSDQNEDV
jgi:predicted nucleic acid-binding Zn ribbon protein